MIFTCFMCGTAGFGCSLCCLYALGICFYRGHRNKALLFTFAMFLFNCASLWTALTNGTRQFRQYKYDAPHYERECAGNSGCFVSVL